ncbi:MAG: prolyl oligopeptidase family serine peptidase [Bacteroidetes bacterium]|nr:prolyl oligopeptidase family serine peptidase [Bacteroidota bacterium]
MKKYTSRFIYPTILLLISFSIISAQKKPVTFTDIMKFHQIKNPTISFKGNWITYESNPDRGDGEAVIKSADGDVEYIFERGSKPAISHDEKWASTALIPEFIKREAAKEDAKLKNDLLYLNLSTGIVDTLLKVKEYSFSENSNWLAAHFYAEVDTSDGKKTKSKNGNFGSNLSLVNLKNNDQFKIEWVSSFAFDSLSNYLALFIADTSGEQNSLKLFDLRNNTEVNIDSAKNGNFTNLTWQKDGKLAYLKSIFDEEGKAGEAELFIWDKKPLLAASSEKAAEGWMIPAKNKLQWTKEGDKLFFGYKQKEVIAEKDTSEKDIYDFDNILAKKELNVWHWQDPKIKTNEVFDWKEVKDQTYAAVYHVNDKKLVRLADTDVPHIKYSNNKNFVAATSELPYLWSATWDDMYYDNYIININTGEKTKTAEKVRENGYLSPQGRYLVYYKNDHWYLYNISSTKTINLTKNLPVQFSDEDHDYPIEAGSYGIGGWTENDNNLFIYDKFDIWKFNTETGKGENHTAGLGRKNGLMLRIVNLDKEKEFFKKNETLLLTAYSDLEKYTAIYSAPVSSKGINKILDGEKQYSFRDRSKYGNKYLFTRESFREYPDLWMAEASFSDPKKLTDLGKQFEEFKWGTPELIEWLNIDGVPIQGLVIKPDNFDPAKKYPVFIYFYRFMTPEMYSFPEIVINHRPKIPVFLGDDYVVFYPDIRFEIGRPGYSATKSLVPGVQKLIELGIADPKAIGIHGHSWGGYQTAFIITQTNIFKCAIAGAPVSNMTSAYSGIRLESGLARQFQYEKSQSRIGGSLFEYPERYIENSPIFFAEKIHTPLLIQHGDIDGAVPWEQSIELYLAMRRLGKDCIFLQYEGEPHHLKKYPNRLDYTIKMKEYMDYHLKGAPAPDWIEKGVPYKGK